MKDLKDILVEIENHQAPTNNDVDDINNELLQVARMVRNRLIQAKEENNQQSIQTLDMALKLIHGVVQELYNS